MRRVVVAASLALASLAACGDHAAPPKTADGAGPPATAFATLSRQSAERMGVPPEFTNDLGMKFVLVPAGAFSMGSPASEAGRGADEIPHDVQMFGAYYVESEEVSAAAFAKWRGNAPAAAEGPARSVAHADAVAFAEWLTARDATWSYRLPTEAEFEYAARTADAASMRGTSGDLWEWSRDWYGDYPDWEIMNPTGPFEGEERALRGGGPRIAARRHAKPDATSPDVGFRLMATIPYAKADLGACTLTFRSVETNAGGEAVGERPGFEVRLISVFDRLSSRQQKLELPWTAIAGRKTPFTWHVPPGRYYAQVQEPGSEEMRGVEEKIYLDPGAMPPVQTVDLPVPKAGGLLAKPQ